MAKITLVFPYIGELNKFHCFALEQLSKIVCLDILVFTSENTNERAREICSGVSFHSIEKVFKHGNQYNISVENIMEHPYKLCDYRPFFDKIFEFDYEQFWGFGDLDCIYNPERLNILFSEVNDSKGVYGELGHLRIIGKDAIISVQERLTAVIDEYYLNGVDLLNPEKGYALDEHRFFNVLCEQMHLEGTLKWYKNHFSPIWDVDYKHIIPKNLFTNLLTFDRDGIYEEDGSLSDLAYIHLQKRKIFTQENNLESTLSMFFCEINGDVCFTSYNLRKEYNPSIASKIRFYMKVFVKRVRYRISNYGFSKRPSLICKK
ncbi:DUF6625 family protein [Aeromonas caviae]|uniref:DUF6625 family protein n=2 Tax=Aeromonas caviae TaxID=648 RepID=A0AAW9EW13_AERCA|nr:DUF6625 family protein [Aeromonas caviae]MDX7719874.1 DUF6625 family protein [Aeromonas caviae]